MSEMVELTIKVPKEVVDSVPDGYDADNVVLTHYIGQGMRLGNIGRWTNATTDSNTLHLVAPRKQRTAVEVVAEMKRGCVFQHGVCIRVLLVTDAVNDSGDYIMSDGGEWFSPRHFTGTESDIKILRDGE